MPHLPPLPPGELDPEQRALHEDMRSAAIRHLQGFTTERADGALLGPFPPMLHFPAFGGPTWEFSKAVVGGGSLPATVREVAILVTGAAFGARYELYAHERVAAQAGLAERTIAALAAGQRPAELTDEQAVAHDVTAALLRGGGPLPASTYRAAVAAFGERGTAELVYLVANYCVVSVLLNAYDSDVPTE